MKTGVQYGLEQARAQLPLLVSEAAAGTSSIITRHGKPCAAVVPVGTLNQLTAQKHRSAGVLALRGTGRGLWGPDSSAAVGALRHEWESAQSVG
ncbi:MAG: type II toxin-antitoxin system Phd/YefM family antitoxin [Betaproteobacteria bacterium]|nr:type II toxin-antitoxin system prevent-host-death family antitoxin [Betaproteobacteria bacterium]